MTIFKCKMCGADIRLNDDRTFGTCDYCGSTMTFPKVSDDQRAAAFNRGNHFRRSGEFDKALAVYEHIITEDDNDAEAHWCCALSRFGVEYVEDPATFEYLPTLHRLSYDSFLQDVDYLAALEHSDGVTRRQYQKDAAKIAEVQKGILATTQNAEPFDIFICYKETDEVGQRTRDSQMAQEVYYQLTDQGFRVFFARITLEDVAGTQYEPYIFAALNSAKVMIAIGTKAEHFNAVWVKNEWSRFLALMKRDHSKVLLPCYRDMAPYDLPEGLSVLQSYDMSKIGFIQDLVRGVKKVLSKEDTRPQITIGQQASPSDALTERGYMFLEDGNFEEAGKYFERALDGNPKHAQAYFGKVLVSQKCTTADELQADITGNRDFQRAIQFANETERAKYAATAERILKDIRDARERARIAREKAEAERKAREEKAAAERKAREEKAAAERKAQQEKAAAERKAQEEKNRQLAAQIPRLLKEYEEYNTRRSELLKQAESVDMGTPQESPETTAIRENLADANTKLAQLKQDREIAERRLSGIGLFHGREKKELQARIELFSSKINRTKNEIKKLKDEYKEQQKQDAETRNRAIAAMIQRRKADAYKELPLLSLKEFAEKQGKQDVYIINLRWSVGEIVTFGHCGGEAIDWLVLEATGDRRVLISAKGLDAVRFNKNDFECSKWENSYIRTWLNETFYNEAFTDAEKANLVKGITGDEVYLLSTDEAGRYFVDDDARVCNATVYAINNGVHKHDNMGACWWWLRTTRYDGHVTTYVRSNGFVYDGGDDVRIGIGCVRPVVVVARLF